MGMNYSFVYHDAHITPERYGELIEWSPEEIALEPERAARLALQRVYEVVGDYEQDEVTQDAEGIKFDKVGYHESAGYGFGETLREVLGLCEPGAWAHEIDVEESSGEQWRYAVTAERTVVEVKPTLAWPDVEGVDW